VPLTGQWTTIVFEVDREAWRAGVNRITLTFGRAASPADVGMSGDTRVLAGAVDYIRVETIQER
jgi:hypothetical protein